MVGNAVLAIVVNSSVVSCSVPIVVCCGVVSDVVVSCVVVVLGVSVAVTPFPVLIVLIYRKYTKVQLGILELPMGHSHSLQEFVRLATLF